MKKLSKCLYIGSKLDDKKSDQQVVKSSKYVDITVEIDSYLPDYNFTYVYIL